MKNIFFLFTSLIFISCSTSYICESNSDTPIYLKKSEKSDTVFMIPMNSQVIVIGKSNKFKKIKFNNYEGWTNSNSLKYISKNSITSRKKTSTYKNNDFHPSTKTVNVKGYYRKNGEYVKPHTRSTPKSYKRK